MTKKSINYFNKIIMPFINEHHADIMDDMSFTIEGSVGLGIDDEYSDVEAAIYLPDNVWKENGMLQINLDKLILKTNLWQQGGSGIQVYPLSWLLDRQGENILKGNEIEWEKIQFDSLFGLFNLHNDPIWHDPQNRLSKLRDLTTPDKIPEVLWKKMLLEKLSDFVTNGMHEINRCVHRKNYVDALIPLGEAVKALLEIGFIICRRYYPYRKHLSWAFNRLPSPVSNLENSFDLLSISNNWQERMRIMETIYNSYKAYIISTNQLPELDFNRVNLIEMPLHDNEFYIAKNVLNNPNWKDEQVVIMEKTLKLGLEPEAARWVSWWEMV